MKRLFLILLIPYLFLSCKNEKEFRFDTGNMDVLGTQVQAFIDSLKSENPDATTMFRNDSVKFWTSEWERKTEFSPSIITSDVSFNQIEEFDGFSFDSLQVIGDTIIGLLVYDTTYYSVWATLSKTDSCRNVFEIALLLNEKKIDKVISTFKSSCFVPHDYNHILDVLSEQEKIEYHERRDNEYPGVYNKYHLSENFEEKSGWIIYKPDSILSQKIIKAQKNN